MLIWLLQLTCSSDISHCGLANEAGVFSWQLIRYPNSWCCIKHTFSIDNNFVQCDSGVNKCNSAPLSCMQRLSPESLPMRRSSTARRCSPWEAVQLRIPIQSAHQNCRHLVAQTTRGSASTTFQECRQPVSVYLCVCDWNVHINNTLLEHLEGSMVTQALQRQQASTTVVGRVPAGLWPVRIGSACMPAATGLSTAKCC